MYHLEFFVYFCLHFVKVITVVMLHLKIIFIYKVTYEPTERGQVVLSTWLP